MTYASDDLLGLTVWCLTCEHTHVSTIPVVTYACGPRCGFGVWSITLAENHATEYPDHLVHAVEHRTGPAPVEAPTLSTDDDGYPTTPKGWARVVCDRDAQVIAGWDDDGAFHQYAPTETILAALLETLETFHD